MSTMRDLIAKLPSAEDPPRNAAFTAIVMERVRARPLPAASPRRRVPGWLAVAAAIAGATLLPIGFDGLDGLDGLGLLPAPDAALAIDAVIAVLILLSLGWIAAGRRA